MLDTSVVVIPLERYNDLLRTETRVNVAVERMYHDDFFNKEEILWILGTELSTELAEEMRIETERIRKAYENKLTMEGPSK